MPIRYTRVGWQDAPSTETPIDAANLNHMDNGILALSEEVDTELPLLRDQINDVSTDIESQIDEKIPPEVSSWLTEHVTPAGSAVVVDDSLTIQGAAADAKKTGDELTSLKEDLYGNNIVPALTWIDGEYIKTDGTVGTSSSYHRTDYVEVDPSLGKLEFTNSGGNYDVIYNAWYDSSKTFIASFATLRNGTISIQPPLNARYMRMSFNKTTTNTVRPENFLSHIKTISDEIGKHISHRNSSASWGSNTLNFGTPIPSGSVCLFVNHGSNVTINIKDADSNETLIYGQNMVAEDSYMFVAPFDIYGIRSYVNGTNWSFDIYFDNLITLTKYNTKNLEYLYEYSSYLTWEVGSIASTTGNDFSTSVAIRVASQRAIYIDKDSVAISQNDAVGELYAFKYAKNGRAFIERVGGNKFAMLDGGYFYRFVLVEANQSVTITSGDIPNYLKGFGVYASTIGRTIVNAMNVSNDGTVYACDGLTKNIYVSKLGQLSGYQSFLVYNNKYYSTDGSNVYVQDGSFDLESTTELSLGHGNSFHLGSNGIGYASGWDDNNVYAVDLNTLTITETISLGTTGYTTAAIDDKNKYAYILQRSSTPSTVDTYNFIVYDYDNESVISTTKFVRDFGACQSMDFCDGRIYMVYGLGTNTVPSGFVVFDTNGVILAEYDLSVLSSAEPEGVCFRRDTKQLLFSILNGSLYVISANNRTNTF